MSAPSTDYAHPVHQQPLALYPGDIPDWRPLPEARERGFVPTLTPMFPPGHDPRKKTGIVVVAPGGGYHVRAEHERTPFAELFNRAGIASALLDYRTCGECEAPLRRGPLSDAQRAVRLVRAHADAWGVHPDRIALMGFSAGGHLTACAGVHAESGRPDGYDAAEKVSSRPDALVLTYAVINGREKEGHGGSANAIAGEHATEEEKAFFHTDDFVNAETPPTFFFHTTDDPAVPVSGALRFALGLSKAGVPFEAHIYPHGPHGVGLALNHPALADWSTRLLDWLRRLNYACDQ